MSDAREQLAVSWSGGKDSAMALYALQQNDGCEPVALLVTVAEQHDRVSIHGVRSELVRRQAGATTLPLIPMAIPADCSCEEYEQRIVAMLQAELPTGVDSIAFGDLFLADVRAGREGLLERASKKASFPIWGRDTGRLANEFIDIGFDAIVVCVDTSVLPAGFAGRRYDRDFLAELPTAIDPCGENGEFHTFVYSGPVFAEPIACELGDIVERHGFAFADVLPIA